MARDDEMLVRSYRYLRLAMVGVLVFLGAAVLRQTWRQDWALLPTVSAYVHTPAQGAFVASLVTLGVCMIALEGTTPTENVLLDLGGMLATVAALVPTSRGPEYERTVEACERAGASAFGIDVPVDCPDVQELEDAARAAVATNVWALLVVGLLGLVATFLLTDGGRSWPQRPRAHRIGFAAACLLYAVTAAVFWFARDLFLEGAHWVAAVGLFLTIIAVVIANALRRDGDGPLVGMSPLARVTTVVTVGLLSRRLYPVIALAMVAVGVVGGLVALLVGGVAVFWLEAALIVLFAVFWGVQTRERWHDDRPPGAVPGGTAV